MSVVRLCLLLCAVLMCANAIACQQQNVSMDGRVYPMPNGSPPGTMYDWSGIHFLFTFEGAGLSASIIEGYENAYNVYVDSQFSFVLNTTSQQQQYTLASGLSSGTHQVSMVKRTEALWGLALLESASSLDPSGAVLYRLPPSDIVSLPGGTDLRNPMATSDRRIEFIGDSVTCAYGILGTYGCSFTLGTQDIESSYVALTSSNLSATYHVECWSGLGVVRNYGDPNTTSTDPFPILWNRTLGSGCAYMNPCPPAWDFESWVPQAVVIHLGGNDFSTEPHPPNATFINGYMGLLSEVFASYPKGLQVFHLCGPMYGDPCELIEQALDQWNTNVGAQVAHYVDAQNILNFPEDIGCDGHPNWIGHAKLAAILTPAMQSVMGWK